MFGKLTLKTIIISAILVRLLVMVLLMHPDIKTYNFQASFLGQGVWNIYNYLPEHKSELALKEEFVYFPLTYFTLGVYQVLISPLLGSGFYTWLGNAGADAATQIGVFRYLFLLKLPYLFLDLFVGYLLTRLYGDPAKKLKVLSLWLLNPFTIILLYGFSNVDIFPVTFSVLSLWMARKRQFVLSALMLAIGASFKAYPILLLPVLMFFAPGLKSRILMVLGSAVVLFLAIGPFMSSEGFRQATLTSGLMSRIVENGLSIGFGEMLLPTIVIFGAIFTHLLLSKRQVVPIHYLFLVMFMVLFSTIHYHIQWLLWMAPFAVMLLVDEPDYFWGIIIFALVGLFIPLTYNDHSMTFGLLSPISYSYNTLPIPFDLVSKFSDPDMVISALHSVLLGVSLVLSWKLLKVAQSTNS